MSRSTKETDTLVVFTWDGSVMRPIENFHNRCGDLYEVGHRYSLVPYGRSQKTHDHFFACVYAAWKTWPENYPIALPTADHLRKHALIRTGHYHESIGCFASAEEASAFVATFMRAVIYAEYAVFENVARVRVAKSQKKKEMGAAMFQQSKQEVLDFLTSVLGVDVTTLVKEAKRDAA